ncbi:glycosyltransferase [Planctomonas sp. JC2975]|uniref:glycosyltransferase n=1 Tax=Planctomonas sp. JC2975 TaxID=2729626 RepID=UPI00147633EB|nr:glycosyltransferase [Planctomonas sp. JC2975]NNC13075.1 glycosyltransferase [Planctomonas sp. JC2975]
MAPPPFSLLMPVYHGDDAGYLLRAFRSSVVEQSVRPSEVVLVQDGPVSAHLVSAIAELDRSTPVPLNIVILPENRGLSEALTAGLAECSYEVVARMDADDVSEPNRFEIQLDLIEKGYELVGSGLLEFSETEHGEELVGVRRTPPTDLDAITHYARFHDPFNHPTVVYTKQAVELAGGYRPMGMMEDYWLFVRMLKSGVRAVNSPEPLVRYRISSGAYKRRGGLRLLRSEWMLQRAFLRSGFTSRRQFLRNVVLRGAYRLTPEVVRRRAYRSMIVQRGSGAKPAAK